MRSSTVQPWWALVLLVALVLLDLSAHVAGATANLTLGVPYAGNTTPLEPVTLEIEGTFATGDILRVYAEIPLTGSALENFEGSMLQVIISQYEPLQSTSFSLPATNQFFTLADESTLPAGTCKSSQVYKNFCVLSSATRIGLTVISSSPSAFTITVTLASTFLPLNETTGGSVGLFAPSFFWFDTDLSDLEPGSSYNIRIESDSDVAMRVYVQYETCDANELIGFSNAVEASETVSKKGMLSVNPDIVPHLKAGNFFVHLKLVPLSAAECFLTKQVTLTRLTSLPVSAYGGPIAVMCAVCIASSMIFMIVWAINLAITKKDQLSSFTYIPKPSLKHSQSAEVPPSTGGGGLADPESLHDHRTSRAALAPQPPPPSAAAPRSSEDMKFGGLELEEVTSEVKDAVSHQKRSSLLVATSRAVAAAEGEVPVSWTSAQTTLAELDARGYGAQEKRGLQYLATSIVVATFYGLLAGQVAVSFQDSFNNGNRDLCAYNFYCANQYLQIRSFNNFISNLAFMIYGTALLLISLYFSGRFYAQVRAEFKRIYLRSGTPAEINGFLKECKRTGVAKNIYTYYAVSFLLISEGVFSALYHLCPNASMFQFDTTFMYAITVLLIVNLFQKRHPDITPDPSLAYAVIGVCVFFTAMHTYASDLGFWISFLVVDVVISLFITIYYFLSGNLARIFYNPLACKDALSNIPLVTFVSLLMVVHWGLLLVAVVLRPDFASVVLGLLILNFACYLLYYMILKIVYDRGNRKVIWKPIILFLGTLGLTAAALYFFLQDSSDKNMLPMISRNLNSDCIFMGFFDSHDLWHFFAAAGLFLASISLLYLDVDLAEIPSDKIKAF